MITDELVTARRDAVHALCVAQARDQLSVEAFEHRLELLREAPTAAAARQIVGDLESTGDYAVPSYPDPSLPAPVAPLERMRISAVFSGAKRSGQWTVPLVIEARIMFGNIRLDLRDAWFESDTLLIEVEALCGGLDLIVPPGTQVEIEVDETMSGSHHKPSRAGAELNGLLVRISGRLFMSGLKIVERMSTRDHPPGHYAGVRGLFNRMRDDVS